MSLPNLPAGDKFRREVRTEWGGLNLNENAGDGELIVAMNMSSREYPLLANVQMLIVNGTTLFHAPFYHNGLGGIAKLENTYHIWDLTKTPRFRGTVSVSDSTLESVRHALVNHKLYMFPNKEVYDCLQEDASASVTSMEASWDNGSGNTIVEFSDHGVAAIGGDLSAFRVGDEVQISGCAVEDYNTTAIIRNITYWDIEFDYIFPNDRYVVYCENGLTSGADYWFSAGGETYRFTAPMNLPEGYIVTEPDGILHAHYVYNGQSTDVDIYLVSGETSGTEIHNAAPGYATSPVDEHITISRTVPDMDFICENENRLWGCKGDTIYASKLGDPLNWNVFDGLSTDCWSAQTGTPGDFTGCCSFQGYPIFFKAGEAFRVVGDIAENFTLRRLNVVGVAPACDRSIVEIRGKLYYLSPIGIVEWNGGDYPQVISHALTGQINKLAGTKAAVGGAAVGGVAGTDGLRYYIELQYQATQNSTVNRLFVYDTRFGTWHELERGTATERAGFCGDGADAWMIRPYQDGDTTKVRYYQLSGKLSLTGLFKYTPDWEVRFADSTRAYKTALTGSESKKGVLRLLIRCKLAGTMKIWISYDGGRFEEAGEFGGEDGMEKTSRVVPLILRRCDYWQLRLTGAGDAVIYSIAVEKYGGEWQQA